MDRASGAGAAPEETAKLRLAALRSLGFKGGEATTRFENAFERLAEAGEDPAAASAEGLMREASRVPTA